MDGRSAGIFTHLDRGLTLRRVPITLPFESECFARTLLSRHRDNHMRHTVSEPRRSSLGHESLVLLSRVSEAALKCIRGGIWVSRNRRAREQPPLVLVSNVDRECGVGPRLLRRSPCRVASTSF